MRKENYIMKTSKKKNINGKKIQQKPQAQMTNHTVGI